MINAREILYSRTPLCQHCLDNLQRWCRRYDTPSRRGLCQACYDELKELGTLDLLYPVRTDIEAHGQASHDYRDLLSPEVRKRLQERER